MSYLIKAIGLRLVLAAIIHLVTVAVWIGRTTGWAVLGLFGWVARRQAQAGS